MNWNFQSGERKELLQKLKWEIYDSEAVVFLMIIDLVVTISMDIKEKQSNLTAV